MRVLGTDLGWRSEVRVNVHIDCDRVQGRRQASRRHVAQHQRQRLRAGVRPLTVLCALGVLRGGRLRGVRQECQKADLQRGCLAQGLALDGAKSQRSWRPSAGGSMRL